MKKFVIKELLLIWFLIYSSVSSTGAVKAALDGSFITGDLCASWSDARWQEEFTSLKNAGMHYVIIQAIADSYPGRKTETIYPSTLPNTALASYISSSANKDIVDACLRNAESAGIKVFIGIDMSTNWWNVYGNDTTWLYNQMKLDNQICDEVWNLYKTKYPNAFYGWYWSYEVDNVNFKSSAQQSVLINAMNLQLDHLNSSKEKLPFMWCPFMNSSLGTPQAYELMWENVFAGLQTSPGDIFCPQDCVGAGGLKLNEVVNWFSALRQAVDTKPGLVMWSDVETFEISTETTATLDRVISQLKMEQPYVDNYVSWEYCYYDSPNNIDPGFQETYIDYLNTGVLDTTAPTDPTKFSAVLKENGDAALSWDAATDNIGICGYNVYRNGSLIYKSQVPRKYGGSNTYLQTAYTNSGLAPNTTYTYQVQAYDFANNVSALSTAVSIATGNVKTISTGCIYKTSIPADKNYPDVNNKKLTDGIFASKAYYADPAWVGFSDPFDSIIDVVIDLGAVYHVKYFIAEYLLDPQPAVFLPKKVIVSISTDNTTFTDAGELLQDIPIDSVSSIYKYYNKLSSPVDARYIKFSTTPGGYWTFCDEFEVRSNNITGISNSNKIFAKYYLSQNYPNPFNPSTCINYEIAISGRVTLKIYNILGEEIKTFINSYKPAGNYSISLNTSAFPAGVYFYRLTSGSFSETKKMIVLK